jgi:hypothetical protein
MGAIGSRDFHPLQVWLEFPSADAGDLRADAAQILLFTARGDLVPNLRAFATNVTLPSHRDTSMSNQILCLSEGNRKYNALADLGNG